MDWRLGPCAHKLHGWRNITRALASVTPGLLLVFSFVESLLGLLSLSFCSTAELIVLRNDGHGFRNEIKGADVSF
jgi:hypothetical protein